MPELFFIRHAESKANEQDILAGRLNFPLSERGLKQAKETSEKFCSTFKIDRILVSPLLRARQTAEFFEKCTGLQAEVKEELTEQNIGIYSGMSYKEINGAEGYVHDRSARWNWIPEGGGESYYMIARRIEPLLKELSVIGYKSRILLVTHAVTLRIFRGILEATLPKYPLTIPANAEVWEVSFSKLGMAHHIKTHRFTLETGHRA